MSHVKCTQPSPAPAAYLGPLILCDLFFDNYCALIILWHTMAIVVCLTIRNSIRLASRPQGGTSPLQIQSYAEPTCCL